MPEYRDSGAVFLLDTEFRTYRYQYCQYGNYNPMFSSTDNCGILVYPLYQVDGHQIIEVPLKILRNHYGTSYVQGYLMNMSF